MFYWVLNNNNKKKKKKKKKYISQDKKNLQLSIKNITRFCYISYI